MTVYSRLIACLKHLILSFIPEVRPISYYETRELHQSLFSLLQLFDFHVATPAKITIAFPLERINLQSGCETAVINSDRSIIS